MPRHKHGGDGEHVLGKFSGRVAGGGVSLQRFVENHEADASLLEDEFHEVSGEATEAVAMGNHNFCENACVRALQNGV